MAGLPDSYSQGECPALALVAPMLASVVPMLFGGANGDTGVSGVRDAGSSIVGDRPMLLTSDRYNT